MQCVILAGGMATRMRPLTETVPKALVPAGGRPFAEHQLSWLARQGVTDVVLSIGHLGALIREFVGDGARWGLRVAYADEGEELRGTAGALRLAADQELLAPVFGVLYGDSYLAASLTEVWSCFTATRATAVMTVFRNEGRYDTSNARFRDGWVERYEKGVPDPIAAGMRYIDYGFSVLDRDAVLALIPPGKCDLSTVYERLSAAHRLRGFEVTERFYEIGSPEGLAEFELWLAEAERR